MTFENTLRSDLGNSDTPDLMEVSSGPLARAEGRVEVSFRSEGTTSRLKHLYQRGCARVRFPTVDRTLFPEAVLINTAGGLTGGDQIAYDIELEPGSRLTVSGQAAEKIYRSVGTTATIDTHLDIGTGAYLEWLPQETILFEKSKLRRLNRVHLATGSCFLAVEATIFGRTAYGESLRNVSVGDGWKIWRDDQLIWFDNFALDGDLESVVGRPAVLGGAKAMATILLADPDIVTCPEFMRKAAEECGERAAVTCRNGLSIMRVFGKDGYGLRRAVAGILTIIRSELAGYPVALPRVWENQ